MTALPYKVRYQSHSGTPLMAGYARLDGAYFGALNATKFARNVRIDTPSRSDLEVFCPRNRDQLFPLVATAIAAWRKHERSTDALIAKCDQLNILWRTKEVGEVVTSVALGLVDALRAEGIEV